MRQNGKIDYVELPATDLSATRTFFANVFGWEFTGYGPDYVAFSNAGLDGGFFRADRYARTQQGCALVVLYADDLEACLAAVEQAGGLILKPIFEFPGGRRFHFTEPSGNELAVWSE